MADVFLSRATYIEFPDKPEIDISEIAIEAGSLLLEEILCESNIVFGETNATRFEATVYNLVDVSGLKIKVYQTDRDGNNRKNLFEGYVDSCKQDKFGYYRELVAYDALYSVGNANVAGWWLQFWENRKSATLKELRESLCTWVGIHYDTSVVLYNDDFVCTKTATLSSVSFNTVLRWICEIQCTVPHIDRDGILRFISLHSKIPVDIQDLYAPSTSEFEGFTTAPVDTVELYDYDNNKVATTNTTGSVASKNIYVLKDNSLLFALEDTKDSTPATDFVRNYLTHIEGIRYNPCTVEMIISDLDLQVGDYIKTSEDPIAGISIILQNTLSGSLLVEQTLKASGNEYLQDSSSSVSAEYLSILKKTENLKEEIITDDLLNYSHTNKEEYNIESGAVTSIINVKIDMPNTSNLVFLATVNLESKSNETREVVEEITIDGEPHTVVRKEKVPVVVEGYFEWNNDRVLTTMPTETYSEDGKHLLNLMYFSIGGIQAGPVSTFQVYLTAKNGTIRIGKNQVHATIISKGSSAGDLPWDGTITTQDLINPVRISKFTPILSNLLDSVNDDGDTPTPATATDNLGIITPQFAPINTATITDDTIPTTT